MIWKAEFISQIPSSDDSAVELVWMNSSHYFHPAVYLI